MTIVSGVIFALLLISAVCDWKRRKVPNGLLFPVMAAGFVYQYSMNHLSTGVIGAAAAFALTFIPVVCKGMGMGDQKLLMAVGSWLSASEVYTLFLYSICAGLFTLIFNPIKWHQTGINLTTFIAGWVAHRDLWLPDHKQSALSLPYAVCLFFAYLYLLVTEGRAV